VQRGLALHAPHHHIAAMLSADPIAARTTAAPQKLANWLMSVAFLVFLMVIVGGITRLTESGLSITEWKPVTGAIPPLNEAQWAQEFENISKFLNILKLMVLPA
jgi:cytochrome c oxidase assembly protein subunit 15